MKPATVALLQLIAGKLNEKSSVYGYLMLFGGFYAQQHQGEFAHWAAVVSGVAGITLFLLNDATVRQVLTGQKPDPKPPTVPQPFDSNKPDKG